MLVQACYGIVDHDNFAIEGLVPLKRCEKNASARVLRSPELSVLRKDGPTPLPPAIATGILLINTLYVQADPPRVSTTKRGSA